MSSFIKNISKNNKIILRIVIFSSIAFSIAGIVISASSIRLIDELGCCDDGDHHYDIPSENGFVYYKIKYEFYPGSCCWCEEEPPELFAIGPCNSFTIIVYEATGTEVSRSDNVFFCYTRSMQIHCGGSAMYNVKIWVKSYKSNPIIGYISIGYVCIWGFSMFRILRQRIIARKKKLQNNKQF